MTRTTTARRPRPVSGSSWPPPRSSSSFYDPTDVFGDLADALAEAFPSIAPPVTGDSSVDAHGADGAGEGLDRG